MNTIQHIYKEEDHFCRYNREIFEKLKKEFTDLNFEEFEAVSERGKELARKYDIKIFPATIVNGKLFAVGRIDENKLRQLLKIN